MNMMGGLKYGELWLEQNVDCMYDDIFYNVTRL